MFFNAAALILVVSESPINASLASSNMEPMTNVGLGTFFSGFFALAAQGNNEIRNFLEIEEKKEIVTCMVIEYPDVKYFRTAPWKVLEYCASLGDIHDIVIENMERQTNGLKG